MVGVIDAVVAGVIAYIGASALGLQDRLAAVLGVVVAVVWNLGLSLYAARASRRELESHPAISPSPEAR
jgi:ABC-type anion transport system duplicated permease subunit